MNAGEQTSRHLLLAVITTVFSTLMSLVTLVMSWEPWMIPLMSVGCVSVWLLHIARIGSDTLYENLCVGLLLIEFFYFSVHPVILFDIPGMACILILALFMLNKKWVLYAIQSIYGAALLYQWLALRTISRWVDRKSVV